MTIYRRIGFLLLLSIPCVGLGLADEPTLSVEPAALAPEVPDAVKAVLPENALVVKTGAETLARFWLLTAPTPAKTPSTELGVSFGQIEPGSLVGAVQIVGGWSDYKENPIAAGTYTLRYGVMPADGNHMGVAVYRDFLLLVPAAQDPGPGTSLGYDDLVAASLMAAGVPHPAVLSLFPIWDEIAEPKLVKNDVDQWTLAVKVGDQVFGLVVEGHGEI